MNVTHIDKGTVICSDVYNQIQDITNINNARRLKEHLG